MRGEEKFSYARPRRVLADGSGRAYNGEKPLERRRER